MPRPRCSANWPKMCRSIFGPGFVASTPRRRVSLPAADAVPASAAPMHSSARSEFIIFFLVEAKLPRGRIPGRGQTPRGQHDRKFTFHVCGGARTREQHVVFAGRDLPGVVFLAEDREQ